ncbi:hypothetical protein D3C72_2580450 [compost metagenome]
MPLKPVIAPGLTSPRFDTLRIMLPEDDRRTLLSLPAMSTVGFSVPFVVTAML